MRKGAGRCKGESRGLGLRRGEGAKKIRRDRGKPVRGKVKKWTGKWDEEE